MLVKGVKLHSGRFRRLLQSDHRGMFKYVWVELLFNDFMILNVIFI